MVNCRQLFEGHFEVVYLRPRSIFDVAGIGLFLGILCEFVGYISSKFYARDTLVGYVGDLIKLNFMALFHTSILNILNLISYLVPRTDPLLIEFEDARDLFGDARLSTLNLIPFLAFYHFLGHPVILLCRDQVEVQKLLLE